jgi:predicted RNase H-like nuclease
VRHRAIGVDGCRDGWVAVTLERGGLAAVMVVDTLAEVIVSAAHEADAAGARARQTPVAVDIPIGLLDADRDADAAARRALPGRAASIFAAPPRVVVDGYLDGSITDHAEATAAALLVTGKGLSMQSWRLVPKIAEADRLARAGHRLLEVHPELAFTAAAGEVLPRKASWPGIATRRSLLAELGIELPDRFPGDTRTTPDDVVDAAICAWVADGAARGEALRTYPERPTQHDHGRPIVIHARQRDPSNGAS